MILYYILQSEPVDRYSINNILGHSFWKKKSDFNLEAAEWERTKEYQINEPQEWKERARHKKIERAAAELAAKEKERRAIAKAKKKKARESKARAEAEEKRWKREQDNTEYFEKITNLKEWHWEDGLITRH